MARRGKEIEAWQGAARLGPDAALNKALSVSHAEFLWLQEQIRRDWAKTRRQLHISAAYRAR